MGAGSFSLSQTLSGFNSVPASPSPPSGGTLSAIEGWLGTAGQVAQQVEQGAATVGVTATALQGGLSQITGAPVPYGQGLSQSMFSIVPWWVWALVAAAVLFIAMQLFRRR